jgi:hypothetical protein
VPSHRLCDRQHALANSASFDCMIYTSGTCRRDKTFLYRHDVSKMWDERSIATTCLCSLHISYVNFMITYNLRYDKHINSILAVIYLTINIREHRVFSFT